ncbi:MAG: permease-like cell division protein FtsX [Candidatus Gracilibacteria bacterium]
MATLNLSVQTSIKNLWRNKYSSIATILLMAIILFVLNIILVVNIIVKNQLNDLGQKINLIVYLQDNIDEKRAQEINDSLKQQDGVKDSVYVSKQTALQGFLKDHPQTAQYYQKFNLENTLPPSIQITVKSPDDYEKVQNFLRASPDSGLMTNIFEEKNEKSRDMSVTEAVTKNLQKINGFSKTLLFWVVTAFLIGSLLIMNNAVHLTIYNRRMEISIMRLVGATPLFIRLPYLLEAIWTSLIAIIISFIGFVVLMKTAFLPEVSLFSTQFSIPFFWLLSGEIIATLTLTLLSSYAAVERHLRKHMVIS